MGTEFEDTLTEITGATNAAAESQLAQAPEAAAPVAADSNAFDQALAERMQEATPASVEPSHDAPEPGGGMEH